MNEIEKPTKIYMHKLDLPCSKRIQFEKIIRTQSNTSSNHLAQSSLFRNEMIIVIEKSSSESIILALEKYITQLYALVYCVEDNASLRLMEQLTFSWSSSFSKGSFVTGYSLRFELIMSLVCLGLAHYNRAIEINDLSNETNFDENAKLMVNHLKISSGIFEYISKCEISKWLNPPDDRPIECFSNYSIAMSTLCMSLANFISIIKAIRQGVSHILISKIACESWHKAELAKNQFKDLPHFKKIPKSFRNYLNNLISLLYSLTMMEMSFSSKDEQKFDDALGYFACVIPFSKLARPSNPKELSQLEALMNDILYQQKSIEKENELIYFTKATDPKQLPQAQPKTIMQSLNYSPPCPAFLELI